ATDAASDSKGNPKKPSLGGAELRNAQKEFAAAERKLAKLAGQVDEIHARMAAHDQNDYEALGALSTEISALSQQSSQLETRWLELSELLGD
ncbi:MAG: ABC transporter C-terminal domain-containing protein, partial [Terrimesophilobacter sp.]